MDSDSVLLQGLGMVVQSLQPGFPRRRTVPSNWQTPGAHRSWGSLAKRARPPRPRDPIARGAAGMKGISVVVSSSSLLDRTRGQTFSGAHGGVCIHLLRPDVAVVNPLFAFFDLPVHDSVDAEPGNPSTRPHGRAVPCRKDTKAELCPNAKIFQELGHRFKSRNRSFTLSEQNACQDER
jgi:hypothetical protein